MYYQYYYHINNIKKGEGLVYQLCSAVPRIVGFRVILNGVSTVI